MRPVRRLPPSVPRAALIGPLAAAFLLSCVLLTSHASSGQKFEYATAGELLLVAVLSLEGIVAVRHLQQARLESVHQVLVAVLKDYRSAEMMAALNALWRFRREHGDEFVHAYLERWRSDDARIARLPEAEQLRALRATVHYRRRLVKEFYNMLAGLYELGVMPREVLYTYWNEAELKILPEVLIPLETAVARELRVEKELGGWSRRLRRLHDDQQP